MRPKMTVTPELVEQLSQMVHSYLDEYGREVNNPLPHTVDAGLDPPMTLQQQIQRLLRRELSAQAQSQGLETFQEADDFDVDEPFEQDLRSAYEMVEEDYVRSEPDPAANTDPAASNGPAQGADPKPIPTVETPAVNAPETSNVPR